MAEPDRGASCADRERRAARSLALLDEACRIEAGTEPGVLSALFEQAAGELLERARVLPPVVDPLSASLQPRSSPAVQGYDIAGWDHPSDVIGGDFFDFEGRGDGRLMVAMGDVSGHGQAAALVAAACLALLRSTLLTSDEPAVVVSRLNRLLRPDHLDDRFVTAFYGMLEPESHRLEYISAGQGPILFYSRASGTIAELEIQGFPLGLSPELAFGPSRGITFAPGDMLALITDGFFEWFNGRGDCYGVERMKAQIESDRDQPAAAIIHRLHASVLEFAGDTPQPDDLTAVVIKRRA